MIVIESSGQVKDGERLERFASAVIGSFFTKRFKRDVTISIHYKKVLDGGNLGLCFPADSEHIIISVARKNYFGEYHSPLELAKILAHELVHAKQFFKRQYDFCYRFRTTTTQPYVDFEGVKYEDQPWEIEAFALEGPLTDIFWPLV